MTVKQDKSFCLSRLIQWRKEKKQKKKHQICLKLSQLTDFDYVSNIIFE